MTLRTARGQQKAESVEDVRSWLRNLTGGPAITRSIVARCTQPLHGDDPATWFYVEADSREGVARLRCLACGNVNSVLDSADRWTYPTLWSCNDCSQSIAEIVFGIHDADGVATWLVVAARCVQCGNVTGLTDFVVPDLDADTLAVSL